MTTTVFITGASRGIGEALAIEFGKMGYRVGLFSRNKEKLDQLKVKIENKGGEALVLPGDVRDINSIKNAYEKIEEIWKFPDIVIANAGVIYWKKSQDLEINEVHDIIDVNFSGFVNTVQLVLPRMIANGGGQIVGITSSAAFRGLPYLSIYSATKGGVLRYLEAIRVENKANNIDVTAICPGFINTSMVNKDIPSWLPLLFLMEPAECAKKIVAAINKKKKLYIFPIPILLLAKISPFISDSVYEKIFIPLTRWLFTKIK
ncbi:MAG: SDR family NAD(P)-dependent oxidoreductase [Candidatus Thermoplasmatota archaeon]|nr:SDR family NAD(P)-dependent oxidoreductase [Candidatus Thermoplasmatota archaeon]